MFWMATIMLTLRYLKWKRYEMTLALYLSCDCPVHTICRCMCFLIACRCFLFIFVCFLCACLRFAWKGWLLTHSPPYILYILLHIITYYTPLIMPHRLFFFVTDGRADIAPMIILLTAYFVFIFLSLADFLAVLFCSSLVTMWQRRFSTCS
jgi:hypothetical protein